MITTGEKDAAENEKENENENETAARVGPVMLAYEVDGFGSHLRMDDANVPSLLSLPYLGYLERCGHFF
jgi:meiotically up-regulated gene 157 (Mug157) protein